MNPKEIKITVATVTWNPGALLERTLRSVEEQTHPLIQHVIVDGRSADQTLTLIRQYQERNASGQRPQRDFTLLSEPDNGLYDAMNKAILLATGDYIVFLNAGDKFHSPDTLAIVAKTAARCVGKELAPARPLTPLASSQSDADISHAHTEHTATAAEGRRLLPAVVYGHTDIVDDSGAFLRPRHLSPPENLTWQSFADGMLVCHQAFYARADIAKRTPYNLNYRFSADYDWCIRILQEGARFSLPNANTHAVLADFLQGGMTTKNHRRSLIERYHIMSAHYGASTALARHISFLFRALRRKFDKG